MLFYASCYALLFAFGDYLAHKEWRKDVKRAQRLKEGRCQLYSRRGE